MGLRARRPRRRRVRRHAALPAGHAARRRRRRRARAGCRAGRRPQRRLDRGETAGLALGPTLVLGILAVTGFVSHTATEAVAQPASARLGVVLAFTVLPAALTLLSLVPLSRYPLSAAVVDAPTDQEHA
ncbi:MFS transporter [Luteimicrobium album]|uniref:MFS transporter n=1 Tax=Luteimicrobium album TaxID=1054550 RepID=UPI003D66F84D